MSPLHNARSRDSSSIFSARKPRGVRRLRCSPLPSLPAGGSFRLDRYGKRSDTTGMNATVNSTNRNRANLLTVALPGSWPAAMARDVAPAPITSDGRAFFSPVCRAGGSAVMVGSTRRPATDPSSVWVSPVLHAGRQRRSPPTGAAATFFGLGIFGVSEHGCWHGCHRSDSHDDAQSLIHYAVIIAACDGATRGEVVPPYKLDAPPQRMDAGRRMPLDAFLPPPATRGVTLSREARSMPIATTYGPTPWTTDERRTA